MRFIELTVLDSTGAGSTSDVIRAIDFAVANKTKYGIHIINLSLGHPIYEPAGTDPLVQAVERASRAGAENTAFQTRNPGSTAGMTYGAAIVLPDRSAQKTRGPRKRTTATMTK